MKEPEDNKIHIGDMRFYRVQSGFHKSANTTVGNVKESNFSEDWRGEVGNDYADERMDLGAKRGSEVHKLCDLMLKGQKPSLQGCETFVVRRVKAAEAMLREMKPYVLASEHQVDDFETETSGTLDGVLEASQDWKCGNFSCKEGEVLVIDWKTGGSVSKKNMMVTAFYCHAWNMTNPDKKAECPVIIHLNNTVRGYTLKRMDDWLAHLEAFWHAEGLWRYFNPNATPNFMEFEAFAEYSEPERKSEILLDPYGVKGKVST